MVVTETTASDGQQALSENSSIWQTTHTRFSVSSTGVYVGSLVVQDISLPVTHTDRYTHARAHAHTHAITNIVLKKVFTVMKLYFAFPPFIVLN